MKEREVKKTAIQIAGMLPDRQRDALRVIRYLRKIAEGEIYCEAGCEECLSGSSSNATILTGRFDKSPR